ncbi:branched-chain amino acid ABC transporter permease [Hoeflea prorocentri]|uniref:Branched-chain amino acid ABC transporter permease n=1 Tax=Hoeflea prorocentri TaxID=1922333 RepID=A0A9X3ZIM5_9HYPH|nr:branched-chain amino acid ABC transporter permease [Hoeflea prorocentri]MCY6382604.1 branched-chain amino acid ABC transporter permease [Hoeflea prorocentri]MDA5400404.1 branched-chain amino acid ABC transporter permease [Hoeflea prorocentri]
MIQALFDGILVGSVLSLGAIGLTLVMHILRFANFSHAELLSVGAYCALTFDAILSAVAPPLQTLIGPFSMSFALALATIVSVGITGLTAVLVDRLVFKRLRATAGPLTLVFASFGVALIMRNVIALVFGLHSQRYSDDISFAVMISADPLLLIKPDQVIILCIAVVAMAALHLLLNRTTLGFALRAVAENPTLAQVNGISMPSMVRLTWMIGGGLAAVAGVLYGLDNQLSPVMGRDLVLSLFAAAIVGGLGSVSGAVLGGFIVGLASSFAILLLPAGYKPAIPFLVILATLYLRPNGLFGEAR